MCVECAYTNCNVVKPTGGFLSWLLWAVAVTSVGGSILLSIWPLVILVKGQDGQAFNVFVDCLFGVVFISVAEVFVYDSDQQQTQLHPVVVKTQRGHVSLSMNLFHVCPSLSLSLSVCWCMCVCGWFCERYEAQWIDFLLTIIPCIYMLSQLPSIHHIIHSCFLH